MRDRRSVGMLTSREWPWDTGDGSLIGHVAGTRSATALDSQNGGLKVTAAQSVYAVRVSAWLSGSRSAGRADPRRLRQQVIRLIRDCPSNRVTASVILPHGRDASQRSSELCGLVGVMHDAEHAHL